MAIPFVVTFWTKVECAGVDGLANLGVGRGWFGAPQQGGNAGNVRSSHRCAVPKCVIVAGDTTPDGDTRCGNIDLVIVLGEKRGSAVGVCGRHRHDGWLTRRVEIVWRSVVSSGCNRQNAVLPKLFKGFLFTAGFASAAKTQVDDFGAGIATSVRGRHERRSPRPCTVGSTKHLDHVNVGVRCHTNHSRAIVGGGDCARDVGSVTVPVELPVFQRKSAGVSCHVRPIKVLVGLGETAVNHANLDVGAAITLGPNLVGLNVRNSVQTLALRIGALGL